MVPIVHARELFENDKRKMFYSCEKKTFLQIFFSDSSKQPPVKYFIFALHRLRTAATGEVRRKLQEKLLHRVQGRHPRRDGRGLSAGESQKLPEKGELVIHS